MFYNPPNSNMDYMILNSYMHRWSFRQTWCWLTQHHILTRTDSHADMSRQWLIHTSLALTLTNRPLLFILLSYGDNQSGNQSTTKDVVQLLQSGHRGNVLTLILCVLRFDQTESIWMPTDLVKFPVHSIRLLRKKLRHIIIYMTLCQKVRKKRGQMY